MLSLSVLALAGLFAIYRSKGLKTASAAAVLCILLVATLTFFFGETVERLLSLNRGVLPSLEAEIRNWDIEMMTRTGLLLRYELFLDGLRAFAENPLFGQGLGASMGDGTHKELLHGIPIIYAAGYGLVGLTALVALFFPRVGMDMPNDWLFMKASILIVVIGTSFHLQHPPFWFAAAAMFLQMPHKNSV